MKYLLFSFDSALVHFGEAPNIFRNLKVDTLIKLLKDETCAQPIFALIFEKTCRDLNDVNINVLDELFELLKQFSDNDQSQQHLLLQIAVLVICDLWKDYKHRQHYDRFREVLFDIIKTLAKSNEDNLWFIDATLPAFVLIVKTFINENKTNPTQNAHSDDETIQLIKLFLKTSVILFSFITIFMIPFFNSIYRNSIHRLTVRISTQSNY